MQAAPQWGRLRDAAAPPCGAAAPAAAAGTPGTDDGPSQAAYAPRAGEVVRTWLDAAGYHVRLRDAQARARLVARLTARPRHVQGYGAPPDAFATFSEPDPADPLHLVVPRAFGLAALGAPAPAPAFAAAGCGRGQPLSAAALAGPAPALRAPQRAALDALLAACRDPARAGGVLSLPTGAGKTVVALAAVRELGRRALVVVHKSFLEAQWMERARQFLPGARLGVLRGDRAELDADIVVASLQTLTVSARAPAAASLAGFGTVVHDEAHHMGAQVFSRALRTLAGARFSVGLSATPDRKDGLAWVFFDALGPLVQLPAAAAQDAAVDVVLARFDGALPGRFLLSGKPNLAACVNDAADCAARTALLAAELAALARDAARHVLVVSGRKAHLAALLAALPDDVRAQAGLYHADVKERERERAARECRVLLATAQMVAEAFDVPRLNALVIATPAADVVQLVGRVLRTPPAQRAKRPLILDVVDDSPGVFARQAAKRQRLYRARGWRVLRRQLGEPGADGDAGSARLSPAARSAG